MNAPASANADRIAQLYDPAYVRRVDGDGGAPVQVCIDERMLGDARGGVSTYARVLAQCLERAGAVPATLGDAPVSGRPRRVRLERWISAIDGRARTAEATKGDAGADRWHANDIFREAQVFFNIHGRLLPIAFERPPAVMHWTYPVPLYVRGASNLYTIHDLIPLTDPALTPISPARHARLLRQVTEHAAGIVTVSETMRTLIARRLGIADERVVNTYQAVDAPLQADPPLPAPLRSGRYLLFFGTVEPRKNIERLLDAYRASGVDLPLVIAGPEAAGHRALEARLSAEPGVVRLGWRPRDQLIGLIRRSRATMFPSLAEGFGLPIAEAMTLGCPVLTSASGATAEIAGNAGLLIDPHDTNAIAAAIARLATDDALCANLRAAGFARGRMFALDTYADRLRALYADTRRTSLTRGGT
jgi:glycosyltransferase involved in cell wall biosynthesis